MTAPDGTIQFNAEADAQRTAERAELTAKLDALDAQHGTVIDETGAEVATTDDGRKLYTITAAGEEWKVHMPHSGALTVLAMGQARRATPQRKSAAMYDFLDFVLPPEAFNRMTDRLASTEENFADDGLGELVGGILEEFGRQENPTPRGPRK